MLILAAITASFVGVRRAAAPAGAASAPLLGLLVSRRHLGARPDAAASRSSSYGEKLEAVVGLVAIGVLLLITNWFFHRSTGASGSGKFHRQRKQLREARAAGFVSAQALGLFVLGLTSVYREGFETVLFLQSLQLSAGHRRRCSRAPASASR